MNKDDHLDLNFSDLGKNKLFYDVIYNPKETNFLKKGKTLGNITKNGMEMFIYQAAASFKVWHGISPEVDSNVNKFLEND